MSEVEKYRPLLKKDIKTLGLSFNEDQLSKLLTYISLLQKWNKVYNLTAIKEPIEIITHHILDSLSIVPYIQGGNVLDIGSGAGLPGIPCAIAAPNKQFVLLDSNGKKTRFMTQAVGELKIPNTDIVQSRVENFKPPLCFETIIARAFASMEKIIPLTKHLLCPKGELLLMKGIYPEVELQKISKHAKVYPLSVPGLHEQRHLVCIKGL